MYTTTIDITKDRSSYSKYKGSHVYYSLSEATEMGYSTNLVYFPLHSLDDAPKAGMLLVTTNNYVLPILENHFQKRRVLTCFGLYNYKEYAKCPCLPIVDTFNEKQKMTQRNFAYRFVRTFDFKMSYETVYNKSIKNVDPVRFINRPWVNYYIGEAMQQLENEHGLSYADLFDLRKKQLATTNDILKTIERRLDEAADVNAVKALVESAVMMVTAQEQAYSGAAAPLIDPEQTNIQINNSDKAVNQITPGGRGAFPTNLPETK